MGIIHQLLGDGFMPILGTPISHGDNSQQAVDTSLAILGTAEEEAAGHIPPQPGSGSDCTPATSWRAPYIQQPTDWYPDQFAAFQGVYELDADLPNKWEARLIPVPGALTTMLIFLL